MVQDGSRGTVASNSLLHYILGISLYPLTLSLCSVDIIFAEEIRNLGAMWRGRAALLMTLRFFYNIIMVPFVFAMIISAYVATLAMYIEKAIWIVLQAVTGSFLSFTSFSRGTQDLLELVNVFVPLFPLKEILLHLTVSYEDIQSSGFRHPYIERGGWSKHFLIQFEFPDPKLRDEAHSILMFNDTACYFPVCYSINERRVLVLSPLGWVEGLNIVQLLKYYTDEHSTSLPIRKHSVSSRWYDVTNRCTRRLQVTVERTDEAHTNDIVYSSKDGKKDCLQLNIGIRDAILSLLPHVFRDLNVLPDLARAKMGQVYITGVALVKLFLSAGLTAICLQYYGFAKLFEARGLKVYVTVISLWRLLFKWGFEPFLGPTVTTIDVLVRSRKMAALYSIAHDSGDAIFKQGTCSWARKTMRGSYTPPEASKVELLLATHTVVAGTEVYQVAMGDDFTSRGTLAVRHGEPARVERWVGNATEQEVETVFVGGNEKVA